MKSIFTCCLIIAAFVFSYALQAQSCLPLGFTFSNQSDIDDFAADNPGCTQILGDVTISDAGITNLNGLNVLTGLGGSLNINGNTSLGSLNGLNLITDIAGNLDILDNPLITNLQGLSGLNTLGGYLDIQGNTQMSAITGLEGLTILNDYLIVGDNPNLADLSGLSGITQIVGNARVSDNTGLNSLGLSALTQIDGVLFISGNTNLSTLTGLGALTSVGGDVAISDNTNLSSFSGIGNLSTIGGSLSIQQNANLSTLAGMGALSNVVGDLILSFNPNLNTLASFNKFGLVGGSVQITNNTSLATCTVASLCTRLAGSGSTTILNNAAGCNSNAQVTLACAALPVDLLSFTYRLQPNAIEIRWETATETNNDYFVVEHSTDGTEFVALAKVTGAGTSNNKKSYRYEHTQPPSGINYYRLKQVDYDGAFTLFNTLSVENTYISRSETPIYPNPTQDIVYLELGGTTADISVHEAQSGKVLMKSRLTGIAKLDLSELKNGVYFIVVKFPEKQTVHKVLKI